MQNGWIIPSQQRTDAVAEYNVTASEYNKLTKQMGLMEMPVGTPDHMTTYDLKHSTLTLRALMAEAINKGAI